MRGPVGIIANPHAGKDIRRLTSHASPTTDVAKMGVIRRAVIGALEAGASEVVLVPDAKGLAHTAGNELSEAQRARVRVLPMATYGRSIDTVQGAEELAKLDAGAVVVLGGDGTHRDVAKGWLDAPIVALSTGTNNVFPRYTEATVAGMAAGLVASNQVALVDVSDRAKVLHVEIDGEEDDLALVDIAVVEAGFTGARAVGDASTLSQLVAAIAEPASVGLSSIAALVSPCDRLSAGAVVLRFAPADTPGAVRVRAPLAPGAFADVWISASSRLAESMSVEVCGPGVLAFDGERDRVLRAAQYARITLRTDGPRVIDPAKTMLAAATHALFANPSDCLFSPEERH